MLARYITGVGYKAIEIAVSDKMIVVFIYGCALDLPYSIAETAHNTILTNPTSSLSATVAQLVNIYMYINSLTINI